MDSVLVLATKQPLWTTYIVLVLIKFLYYLQNRFRQTRGIIDIHLPQQRRLWRSLIGDALLMSVYLHGLTLLTTTETTLMGTVIIVTTFFVTYDWNRALARENIHMKFEFPGVKQQFGSLRTFAFFSFSDCITYSILTGSWIMVTFFSAASP